MPKWWSAAVAGHHWTDRFGPLRDAVRAGRRNKNAVPVTESRACPEGDCAWLPLVADVERTLLWAAHFDHTQRDLVVLGPRAEHTHIAGRVASRAPAEAVAPDFPCQRNHEPGPLVVRNSLPIVLKAVRCLSRPADGQHSDLVAVLEALALDAVDLARQSQCAVDVHALQQAFHLQHGGEGFEVLGSGAEAHRCTPAEAVLPGLRRDPVGAPAVGRSVERGQRDAFVGCASKHRPATLTLRDEELTVEGHAASEVLDLASLPTDADEELRDQRQDGWPLKPEYPDEYLEVLRLAAVRCPARAPAEGVVARKRPRGGTPAMEPQLGAVL
mmetsp:Transcript_29517/g.93137  ORF Transcript_29517/g.93137 Transcript_29517/m.93137 type:complete len:328 (-) Transcript_29517:583-1566(-)